MNWAHANISIFSKIIPCSILIVVTILLMLKLKSVKKRQRSLGTKTDNTEHASNALLAILILFLICELPISVVLLLHLIDRKTYSSVLANLVTFAMMSRLLNASLNLILYYVMSSMFRLTFKETFLNSFSSVKTHVTGTGSENSKLAGNESKNTDSIEMS